MAVVLARRSAFGRRREIADSGCADIRRHSQPLRSPANAVCTEGAHPATVLLATVSCAWNSTHATSVFAVATSILAATTGEGTNRGALLDQKLCSASRNRKATIEVVG